MLLGALGEHWAQHATGTLPVYLYTKNKNLDILKKVGTLVFGSARAFRNVWRLVAPSTEKAEQCVLRARKLAQTWNAVPRKYAQSAGKPGQRDRTSTCEKRL